MDKKRRLLDAAEQVYFRDGDLGLTVRRLATEASTTSQTIYTYFGSRDSVIDSMYKRVLADLDTQLDAMESVATNAGSPAPAADLLAAYRRYALTKPPQFWMMATAKSPEGTDNNEIKLRRQRLVELIGRATRDRQQPDDGMTTDSPHLVLAAVNGLIEAEVHDLLNETTRPDKLFSDLVGDLLRR